jgi:CRP/FNR family transcriptional regulator
MRAGLSEPTFPFLGRLSEPTRRELGRLVPTRVGSGKRLLLRGDPVDGAYLVVRGSLRVYYIRDEGREATLYHVERGGTCILALTATFNREPYPAWVDAGRAGADFVRVPSEVFFRLFDGEPAFRHFIFGVLASRVFELMCNLEEAGSTQIDQRVARYLVRHMEADGAVRASQAGIASELGTVREVVFRALRSLAARKVIRTARVCIRVLDLPRLRHLAETGRERG